MAIDVDVRWDFKKQLISFDDFDGFSRGDLEVKALTAPHLKSYA